MVSITVLDLKAARHERALLAASETMLHSLQLADKTLEIFIVGSAQMNKNVLAFPANPDFPRPDLEQAPLGEIHINPTYIAEHGEDLMHMLAHGLLHLIGYDHEQTRDRMKMEKKERELLALLQRE